MLLLQAAIWISMFAVYFASPVLQVNDSQYSMLTAESIIHNHTPDLSSYTIKNYDADLPFNTIAGKHPYQLMHTNGRLLYGFPHGTPILSIPFVAAMDLFGISPATPDGQYNLAGEVMVEKLLAALLMASLVVVFFRTATLMLDWLWGTSIAIGAGLGTSLWSTGSRGMWSNSWEMMLVGLLVYLLLSGEVRRTSVRPLLLATLLSWMFFVRPTAIGPIVCVSLYRLAFRRREFLPFALGAALWLGALAIYSIRIFGTIFPSYYQQLWAGDANWVATGIFGNLFGPSRGLFVYCPALLAVSYLSIRNWRAFKYRPLVVLSLCCECQCIARGCLALGLVGRELLRTAISRRHCPVDGSVGDSGDRRDPGDQSQSSQSHHRDWSCAPWREHRHKRARRALARNASMELHATAAPRCDARLVAPAIPRRMGRSPLALRSRRRTWIHDLRAVRPHFE